MKVIRQFLTTMVAPGLLVLAACGPPPEPVVIVETVPVEVTRIVEVEGEVVTVVQTRVIEIPVEVEATAEPEPAPGKDTLVICLGGEPGSLYSVTAGDTGTWLAYNAANDVASDSDTGYWFYTELLEKLPTLEDGDAVLIGEEGPEGQLQMTYRVREGIRWHDGEPLTAEDFQYVWEVMMDPESGLQSRSVWERVESMEVEDDLTLRVTLKKGVMDPMYGPYYIPEPLPKHLLGEMSPEEILGSEYARTSYPGTGPFVFEEWMAGDHISFTKNPDYWQGGPNFERVVYRFILDSSAQMAALIAGECDVAGGLSAGNLPFLQHAKDRGLIDYHAGPSIAWEHFDMNVWPWDGRHPWFARKEVRQAVAYGTNRQQMTDELLLGETEPMQSWLPTDSWAFNPNVKQYAYDPGKAMELLASVGFEDRDGDGVVEAYGYSGTFPDGEAWSIPDGTPFRVSYNSIMGNALRENLAQIFQSNMADIGIQVDLDLMPTVVYFADDGPLSQRRFDIAEFAWVSDANPGGDTLWVGVDILNDAGEVVLREQIPSEEDGWDGQNYAGWVNEEASYLIFDAVNTLQRSESTRLYQRQQDIFMEELPTLPLFLRANVVGFASDLKGWELGPSTSWTWNIHEWYFESD
jgi:peptide/nickel transport system substrate-binding protein